MFINCIINLHLDSNKIRLFNYVTNGYYGFLSEYSLENFKGYEIIESKIVDGFLELYIKEI